MSARGDGSARGKGDSARGKSSPRESGRKESPSGSGRGSERKSGKHGGGSPKTSGRKGGKDGDDLEAGEKSARSGEKSGRKESGREDGEDKGEGDEGSEAASSEESGGEGDGKKKKKERKTLRQRLHCPKCKCCMWACPCMYCCQPDALLDREALIRLMMGTGKTKKSVNMVLIEEHLREDRERCMNNKRKWRRRWVMCLCCNCCTLVAIATVVVILLATNAWTRVNEDSGWAPRLHFGMVYTGGGRLVIAGGTNTLENFGDVWSSPDKGENWNRLIDEAAFGARHGHALVADPIKGNLFVIGGDAGSVASNKVTVPRTDVWQSVDGREWALVTASVPWRPRKRFGAIFDAAGILYIAGGIDSMGISGRNDMWKSEDLGKTWTAVALASPWTARHSFGFVRMPGGTREGRLLIMGGSDGRIQHDVWASDDSGESWHIMKFTHVHEMVYKDVEDRASWSPRWGMGAVADTEGILTVCGGGDDSSDKAFSREVWQIESPPPDTVPWYLKRTTDDRLNVDRYPREWQLRSEPAWSARRFLQSFVDEENVVYIVGGQEAPGVAGLKNDIWKKITSLDLNNLMSAYEGARSQAGGEDAPEEDTGEPADTS